MMIAFIRFINDVFWAKCTKCSRFAHKKENHLQKHIRHHKKKYIINLIWSGCYFFSFSFFLFFSFFVFAIHVIRTTTFTISPSSSSSSHHSTRAQYFIGSLCLHFCRFVYLHIHPMVEHFLRMKNIGCRLQMMLFSECFCLECAGAYVHTDLSQYIIDGNMCWMNTHTHSYVTYTSQYEHKT